jgi:hypothetical protein
LAARSDDGFDDYLRSEVFEIAAVPA